MKTTVLWVLRSGLVGALLGCLMMAAAGYVIGGLMGGLASMTSLGDPERVRSEALRGASFGAVFGLVAGSVTGCVVGLFGQVRVAAIGAAVGALSLGLGGATVGSIRVNDVPVDRARVILLALVGAALGAAAGGLIGWVASPLDRYFVGKLRGQF